MQLSPPPILILRHRKENLKKCSLEPLVGRNDLQFHAYPLRSPLCFPKDTIVLALDAPVLTHEDRNCPILLLDATWKLAAHMEQGLATELAPLQKRSLPGHIRTAYPRRQTGCLDPLRGLASIEALYMVLDILGRPKDGLLDHYYWREQFLNGLTVS